MFPWPGGGGQPQGHARAPLRGCSHGKSRPRLDGERPRHAGHGGAGSGPNARPRGGAGSRPLSAVAPVAWPRRPNLPVRGGPDPTARWPCHGGCTAPTARHPGLVRAGAAPGPLRRECSPRRCCGRSPGGCQAQPRTAARARPPDNPGTRVLPAKRRPSAASGQERVLPGVAARARGPSRVRLQSPARGDAGPSWRARRGGLRP